MCTSRYKYIFTIEIIGKWFTSGFNIYEKLCCFSNMALRLYGLLQFLSLGSSLWGGGIHRIHGLFGFPTWNTLFVSIYNNIWHIRLTLI